MLTVLRPRARIRASRWTSKRKMSGAPRARQATSQFLSCVFGKGVEDFSELSALVYKHFTSLVFRGMRDCLASYRQEQLVRIKAEIAAGNLQRQEMALTPPEEAEATTIEVTSSVNTRQLVRGGDAVGATLSRRRWRASAPCDRGYCALEAPPRRRRRVAASGCHGWHRKRRTGLR